MRKILFVTSELVPFAKSGGLADMVSSLSLALFTLGYDVRIVLPRYYMIDRTFLKKHPRPLSVPLGWSEVWCAIYESYLLDSGVLVYFIDHEALFGRDGIYGSTASSSFDDNLERYTVLSRGAFEVCKMLNWIPDVIHTHDWPTALASVYLNTWEESGVFSRTASVFTIHNIAYQGWFPKDQLFVTQLNEGDFLRQGLESLGNINLMRAGIISSDCITTVSPTYAKEIQTSEYGEGQELLLYQKKNHVWGILNGVDTQLWNPQTDKYIQPYSYSLKDMKNKIKLKLFLQKRLELSVSEKKPIIALISRLVSQKGTELLLNEWGILARIMHYYPDSQIIILGTGEVRFEEELKALASRFTHNIKVRIGFDESLSHMINAGSDFLLMPSLYEPCGLNQLYALRYGTLPIVRRTGGLADTVDDYTVENAGGTGWLFDDYSVDACWNSVNSALETYYYRPHHIQSMQVRAMQKDCTWEKSAKIYHKVYETALQYKRKDYFYDI